MIQPFSFARIPKILFGDGAAVKLGAVAAPYGSTVLLVTGGGSLERSGNLSRITASLEGAGVRHRRLSVTGEPSPARIDDAAAEYRDAAIGAVVAVGGGSVIDAGKAVAAMLTVDSPVTDYLEDVGTRQHPGTKVPLIAVPTTSGTGSEATKNAVLSTVGPGGFKKSLRHENFVPEVALVDPELTLHCPPEVTAATGMDALSQLLEAYVSTAASPMTDALCMSGLACIGEYLLRACGVGARDVGVRAGMAYAALLSGIALANAGLGVIHGMASPVGSLRDVPHGVACGTLLGPAVRVTIATLMEREPKSPSLDKFARAGAVLSGAPFDPAKRDELLRELVSTIASWTEELKIPRLGRYGLTAGNLRAIAEKTGMKNNPAALSTAQIEGILEERL